MDSGYKIFAGVLRNRLDDFFERNNKLSDSQVGFRRGIGTTIDAIYALESVVSREIIREWESLRLLRRYEVSLRKGKERGNLKNAQQVRGREGTKREHKENIQGH